MLASMAKRKRTTEIVCPGCRRGGRENALTAAERTRLPEEHRTKRASWYAATAAPSRRRRRTAVRRSVFWRALPHRSQSRPVT